MLHVKVYSNGTRIGIDLRNRLPEHSGRKIYADLAHNEITGFTSSLGFALAVFNVNNAIGAVIKLNMKENYLHGNKIGLITNNGAFNRTMENGVIEITSQADRLEKMVILLIRLVGETSHLQLLPIIILQPLRCLVLRSGTTILPEHRNFNR